MPETSELHLAVALDGAGWHPAAWRSPDARPQELFSAGYWTDLAREAEAGADELLVTTITHSHADRVRSFELLAREWGLNKVTTNKCFS